MTDQPHHYRMPALAILFLILIALAQGDYIDKRQTAEHNVHIDIQDFVIYGIMDDGGFINDSDYTYDYSDLTVKPEGSTAESLLTSSGSTSSPEDSTSTSTTTTETTSSSTSSLSSESSTSTTAASTESQNSTQATAVNNKENITADANKQPLNAQNFQIPVTIVTEPGKKGYVSSSSIRRKDEDPETPALPGRKCLHGFYLDSRNRCRPISRKPPKKKSFISALRQNTSPKPDSQEEIQ